MAVSEVNEHSRQIEMATIEQSTGAKQIEEATSRLSGLTREISAATEQQSSGAGQVSKNIEHIRDRVQANAETAANLERLASQLNRQAALMRTSVTRFRISGNGSGPELAS